MNSAAKLILVSIGTAYVAFLLWFQPIAIPLPTTHHEYEETLNAWRLSQELWGRAKCSLDSSRLHEGFANDLRGDFVTPRQLQLIRYVRQDERVHYLNAGLLDAVRAEIESADSADCGSAADNWTIISVSKAIDIGRITIDTHTPLESTMQYTLVKRGGSWFVIGIKRTEFRGAG